jgi:hypothetical protein
MVLKNQNTVLIVHNSRQLVVQDDNGGSTFYTAKRFYRIDSSSNDKLPTTPDCTPEFSMEDHSNLIKEECVRSKTGIFFLEAFYKHAAGRLALGATYESKQFNSIFQALFVR